MPDQKAIEKIKRKKVLNDKDIKILNQETESRFFGRVRRA
jgi:hypothetical protein